MDYEERPDWQTELFPGVCWFGSWIAVVVFVFAVTYLIIEIMVGNGDKANYGLVFAVGSFQFWLVLRFMLVVIEIRDKISSGKGQ